MAWAISFHMPLDSPYWAIRLLSVWSSQLVQLRRALRSTAAPPPSVEAPGVTMGEGSADMSETLDGALDDFGFGDGRQTLHDRGSHGEMGLGGSRGRVAVRADTAGDAVGDEVRWCRGSRKSGVSEGHAHPCGVT